MEKQQMIYKNASFDNLLNILKKDIKNKEVLKIIKSEINRKSNHKKRIERILDIMEKNNCFVGFNTEIIWSYLKELDILNNFPIQTNERREIFKNLETNDKIKYIKNLLHYELKDFREVRNGKNEKLKEKMLKKPEYRVLNLILEFEEKVD